MINVSKRSLAGTIAAEAIKMLASPEALFKFTARSSKVEHTSLIIVERSTMLELYKDGTAWLGSFTGDDNKRSLFSRYVEGNREVSSYIQDFVTTRENLLKNSMYENISPDAVVAKGKDGVFTDVYIKFNGWKKIDLEKMPGLKSLPFEDIGIARTLDKPPARLYLLQLDLSVGLSYGDVLNITNELDRKKQLGDKLYAGLMARKAKGH